MPLPSITITLGDVSENHVGMQQNGALAARGFRKKDIKRIARRFHSLGGTSDLYPLHKQAYAHEQEEQDKDRLPKAYVLVLRNAIHILGD